MDGVERQPAAYTAGNRSVNEPGDSPRRLNGKPEPIAVFFEQAKRGPADGPLALEGYVDPRGKRDLAISW